MTMNMLHFLQEWDSNLFLVSLKLRALFYSLWVLSDDEETQKNGVIFVSWAVGYKQDASSPNQSQSEGFKNAVWAMVKLAIMAMPLRHEAFHFCYDNFFMAPIFALIKISLGMFLRVRVRTHYGAFQIIDLFGKLYYMIYTTHISHPHSTTH